MATGPRKHFQAARQSCSRGGILTRFVGHHRVPSTTRGETSCVGWSLVSQRGQRRGSQSPEVEESRSRFRIEHQSSVSHGRGSSMTLSRLESPRLHGLRVDIQFDRAERRASPELLVGVLTKSYFGRFGAIYASFHVLRLEKSVRSQRIRAAVVSGATDGRDSSSPPRANDVKMASKLSPVIMERRCQTQNRPFLRCMRCSTSRAVQRSQETTCCGSRVNLCRSAPGSSGDRLTFLPMEVAFVPRDEQDRRRRFIRGESGAVRSLTPRRPEPLPVRRQQPVRYIEPGGEACSRHLRRFELGSSRALRGRSPLRKESETILAEAFKSSYPIRHPSSTSLGHGCDHDGGESSQGKPPGGSQILRLRR